MIISLRRYFFLKVFPGHYYSTMYELSSSTDGGDEA